MALERNNMDNNENEIQYCDECKHFFPFTYNNGRISDDISLARCKANQTDDSTAKMRLSKSIREQYRYCSHIRIDDDCEDFKPKT
jgi:hypothetical protein